jgi:hypothetical protein
MVKFADENIVFPVITIVLPILVLPVGANEILVDDDMVVLSIFKPEIVENGAMNRKFGATVIFPVEVVSHISFVAEIMVSLTNVLPNNADPFTEKVAPPLMVGWLTPT